jgi:hypothetical protein
LVSRSHRRARTTERADRKVIKKNFFVPLSLITRAISWSVCHWETFAVNAGTYEWERKKEEKRKEEKKSKKLR